ncbi:hypothetical protein PMIN06_010845 [Paraphaeosphaeria minitans]
MNAHGSSLLEISHALEINQLGRTNETKETDQQSDIFSLLHASFAFQHLSDVLTDNRKCLPAWPPEADLAGKFALGPKPNQSRGYIIPLSKFSAKCRDQRTET